MTGSMAAEIILCASLTRVIASSISRCAVSLLLAVGLAMACVEWYTWILLPASSLPFSFSPAMMLLCSANSTSAYLLLSLSRVQKRTYLTSPALWKKSTSCSPLMESSTLTTSNVRRISSIRRES